MSPETASRDQARSAAEINAEIRALWPNAAMRLSEEQRAAYERLIVEWARAMRDEVVEAA